MYSKAASSRSGGTSHAQSAPRARLVESSVWRTRRIVPASQHCDDALDDGLDGNAAALRDLSERIGLKARQTVLRDGEDRGVDGIRNRRRRFGARGIMCWEFVALGPADP